LVDEHKNSTGRGSCTSIPGYKEIKLDNLKLPKIIKQIMYTIASDTTKQVNEHYSLSKLAAR